MVSRVITEKEKNIEKAFGYGFFGAPIREYDGVMRWLENGEIVEFKQPCMTSNNVKFYVNGERNREFWFSQLNGVYIDIEQPNTLECGTICFKNGSQARLFDYNSRTFIDAVKNKKFKVVINEHYFLRIDEKNDKVKNIGYQHGMMVYDSVCEYIFNKIDEGNYSAIKGMAKKAFCYDLIEV